jgi:hypothetical protein
LAGESSVSVVEMEAFTLLSQHPGTLEELHGSDCMGWMKQAGFSSARVEHLIGPDSMGSA